jgi:predicted HTH transcriptional regulator
MKENEKFARMLDEYDRTGKPPWEKIRRSFTLRRMTAEKLEEISKKTGKSMSDIIDMLVDSSIIEKQLGKR